MANDSIHALSDASLVSFNVSRGNPNQQIHPNAVVLVIVKGDFLIVNEVSISKGPNECIVDVRHIHISLMLLVDRLLTVVGSLMRAKQPLLEE